MEEIALAIYPMVLDGKLKSILTRCTVKEDES